MVLHRMLLHPSLFIRQKIIKILLNIKQVKMLSVTDLGSDCHHLSNNLKY